MYVIKSTLHINLIYKKYDLSKREASNCDIRI